MAIPKDASAWVAPMDPSDRVDYVAQFGALLATGETLQDVTIVILPEAVALGLTIIEDAEHGPSIADDTNIEMWFEIDEALRADTAFDGAGASLPVEITVNTDAVPPRRFQRTMVVKVVNL